MSSRTRLDKIAAKLPPLPHPEPEPGAFLDDLPGPVRAYLADRLSRAGENAACQ